MNILNKNINLQCSSLMRNTRRALSCGAGLVAGIATLAGLAACSDWDDHYEGGGVAGSNLSLTDEIKARPELSDFMEVLENTKVFRQHKKTTTSYADVLSGGQALTVFAPVNGTFNKDSLIALTATAEGDSAVEAFFVKNHLASTLRSSSDTATTFLMMNGKRVTIKNNTVSGINIADNNVRGKNGIMHVMDSQLPYVYTIYESLKYVPEFAPIGAKINGFTEDRFDEDNSVSSGVVNGIKVYVDSVLVEENKLMEGYRGIGLLNHEDSTYYTCVPTAAGWQKAWEKAETFFKFPSSMEKGDSLQNYWTCRALLDDCIFSRTVQNSPQDSVISKWYDKSEPQYHVFRKPYAADGIFGKAKGIRECSNGLLYYYDEWPLTPEESYFRKIEQEAEQSWMLVTNKLCSYSSRTLVADSISKNSYMVVTPNSSSSNWTMQYKLSGTLSAPYDFCVVVLPKTVYNPSITKRPCKFKVEINYIDEDGTEKVYKCNDGKAFTSDAAHVDTIVVAEAFQLPACNYDQSNSKVSISIICDVKATENARYNREMYLDCIFLRPNDKRDPENN